MSAVRNRLVPIRCCGFCARRCFFEEWWQAAVCTSGIVVSRRRVLRRWPRGSPPSDSVTAGQMSAATCCWSHVIDGALSPSADDERQYECRVWWCSCVCSCLRSRRGKCTEQLDDGASRNASWRLHVAVRPDSGGGEDGYRWKFEVKRIVSTVSMGMRRYAGRCCGRGL